MPTRDDIDRIFYRGTNPGDDRRVREPFSAAAGKTFCARSPESARCYGTSLEKITAKPWAKILYDTDPEFWRIIRRRRPANGYLGSAGRRGETLVDLVNGAIKRARKLGYDAVSFSPDSDIGTVILNPDAFGGP